MNRVIHPNRTCPECGSQEYVFQSRKKIVADVEQPAALETKYRRKDCSREWREKTPK